MLAAVLDRISGMSDDAAIEAVKLLASDILAITLDAELVSQVTSARDAGEVSVPAALEAATPHDAAELARFVLAVAAAAGRASDIAQTLDATTEPPPAQIELINVLAFGLLRAVFTTWAKGATGATTETTVTAGTDGSLIMHTVELTHTYAVGDAIAREAMSALDSLRSS